MVPQENATGFPGLKFILECINASKSMEGSKTGKKGNKLLFLVISTVTLFILLQCLAFENRWHALQGTWHLSSTRVQLSTGKIKLDESSVRESLRKVALCIPSVLSGKSIPDEEVQCLKEAVISSLENDTVLEKLVQGEDGTTVVTREKDDQETQEEGIIEARNDQAIEAHEDRLKAQEDQAKLSQELEDLKLKLKLASDRHSQSINMMQLKDLSKPGLSSHGDPNWFMSSLQGKPEKGKSEEFRFPSEISQGKLLCLDGNNTHNGTMNKYGFAWKEYLPENATLLPGVTLIADNYWDYVNPWHSLTAVINFAVWRADHGCVVPERLVNYHWGEVVPRMGEWITNILHASLGKRYTPETFSDYGTGPYCLEEAVVHRRGVGGMSRDNLNRVFNMVRCEVYKFCELVPRSHLMGNKNGTIDLTVMARSGAREFSNLSGLVHTVTEQCKLVEGCQVNIIRISNLTFCEQVELMSKTDVLLTSHGAQLTNMMFMPKNASVMEMFPKGWLELAGVGQYIYSWLTDWTGLYHEGTWRDPEGPECPQNATDDRLKCFFYFKDRAVGFNETQLSTWTADVLQKVQFRKNSSQAVATEAWDADCACGLPS